MTVPTRSLKDICARISSGGTPSRKQPEYFTTDGEGHLWVKSKELLDCSISDTEERITDEAIANSSAKYYPANTVLMAMYGANVGQLGWLKRPATVNQAVCGMVVDESTADPRYVFYALLKTRARLAAQAQGAAQQNLNQDLIRNFEIPLPPLQAQRKIANVLSTYDDLIENNARRIKLLERMVQAVYGEWFVRPCQSGKLPNNCKARKLGAVADINAATIKRGTEPPEIDYIDISSVTLGHIERVDRYIFANAPGRARRIVKHGDIIWSCVRPNRRSYALILDPRANLIVSTGFAVITGKSAPYTYLYQALTTDEFVDYLTNRARGAAYPAVTGEDFENATIVLPPKELLDRFQHITVQQFDLIHNLHLTNINLRPTRDLLLPRLISGELNVSGLDLFLEEVHA